MPSHPWCRSASTRGPILRIPTAPGHSTLLAAIVPGYSTLLAAIVPGYSTVLSIDCCFSYILTTASYLLTADSDSNRGSVRGRQCEREAV